MKAYRLDLRHPTKDGEMRGTEYWPTARLCTNVSSMSSVALSRDSSIDVTPSVLIRTRSQAQIASSPVSKHGSLLALYI